MHVVRKATIFCGRQLALSLHRVNRRSSITGSAMLTEGPATSQPCRCNHLASLHLGGSLHAAALGEPEAVSIQITLHFGRALRLLHELLGLSHSLRQSEIGLGLAHDRLSRRSRSA